MKAVTTTTIITITTVIIVTLPASSTRHIFLCTIESSTTRTCIVLPLTGLGDEDTVGGNDETAAVMSFMLFPFPFPPVHSFVYLIICLFSHSFSHTFIYLSI